MLTGVSVRWVAAPLRGKACRGTVRTVTDQGSHGEPASTDAFFSIVYDELKRLARSRLRADERATLSTTELVHETFLKLSAGTDGKWQGRAHFFATASRAMRQVIVDFARRRRAAKRGGQPTRVSLSDAEQDLVLELDEMVALDDALNELDHVDPELRQVVELRFFGGLQEEEMAELLGVGLRTVQRRWFKARLFLLRELNVRRGS
jgi:RNA polymerase sigma factor (TIGR02999 family)